MPVEISKGIRIKISGALMNALPRCSHYALACNAWNIEVVSGSEVKSASAIYEL